MSEREQWWAKWCWVKKHLSRPWNYYAYFRNVIEVPGRAQRAVVRVSADARYVLYVNGKRVHQGPARSWPEFQSYDTIDLAPLLIAGDAPQLRSSDPVFALGGVAADHRA